MAWGVGIRSAPPSVRTECLCFIVENGIWTKTLRRACAETPPCSGLKRPGTVIEQLH